MMYLDAHCLLHFMSIALSWSYAGCLTVFQGLLDNYNCASLFWRLCIHHLTAILLLPLFLFLFERAAPPLPKIRGRLSAGDLVYMYLFYCIFMLCIISL